MKRKNEAKLHLVSEGAGIVGIDIAKNIHCAKIINSNGYELTGPIRFYNDLEGFKKLERIIQNVKNKNRLERIIAGMEPTGHYWKNIAYYLDDRKIPVVFVNPYHVHNSKEMWDNSPTKSDPKDALLIANLIKEGKFYNANLVRGVYADLRRVSKIYFRLKRKLWRALSELNNLIDEYFPECRSLFSNKFGKAARYILEEYFFPEEIVEAGFNDLRENLRKVTRCRLGEEKIRKIYSAAEKSVGIKEGKYIAKLEIELVFDEIDELHRKIKEVKTYMEQTITKTPYNDYLLSIPGINVVVATMFLGEIGDPARYNSCQEIIKLAGLNLKENSSGEHKGKKTISKRGRALLRWCLCSGFLSCICKGRNKELTAWYWDCVENKKIEKMKVVVAGGSKLGRIMFSLVKNKEFYDGNKVLNKEKIFDEKYTPVKYTGEIMPIVA